MLFDPSEYEALFRLSPSETTPILLALARQQAARRKLPDVLTQYTTDGFVAPSALDLRLVHQLDGIALSCIPDFQTLLLAPVTPLGTCSTMAVSSQDRTLTANRGLEVVSDPTNVLALECARKLRSNPKKTIRLATIHQVLRAQPLPKNSGFSRHFRMLAMVSAGMSTAEHGFELSAIVKHLQSIEQLFNRLSELGCSFPDRQATVYYTENNQSFAERVITTLQQHLTEVSIHQEQFSSQYYHGLRVLFGANSIAGHSIPIADTGVFNWMGKLTGNHKFRFVASGMGIQLAPLLFRPKV